MEYVMGGTIKAMLARSYPHGLPLAAVQRYGRQQLTLTLTLLTVNPIPYTLYPIP